MMQPAESREREVSEIHEPVLVQAVDKIHSGDVDIFRFHLPQRVGIAGMRERAKVMKGHFHISSSPSGTVIEVSLPTNEHTNHK